MEYIDTLSPLEQYFDAKEYPTPESYEKATGKKCPDFDDSLPIKLWELHPVLAGPRQLMFDVIAQDPKTGVWIYDVDGVYATELYIMLKTEAPIVNIPPKDFNYILYKGKIINRPLKAEFVQHYDIVKTPDNLSIAARNKEAYAQYLAEKNAPPVAASPEFEKTVLADLKAIKLSLGIK